MRTLRYTLMIGIAGTMFASPLAAQDAQEAPRNVKVSPYIEVSQVLTAQLSPTDDVITFTQIATGVDVNAQGRNAGGSVSVRYERNIGYGDAVDTDTVSGIARGYVSVVPQALTLEAGALASRTRIDGRGAVSPNPQVSEDAESQIYSLYAGPSFATRAGDVEITSAARVGYNRFETDNAVIDANGDVVDLFDDSVTYNGQVRAGTRPGEPLPVGLAVTAGFYQEDLSNLDQRVRDTYVRGDVTVPVSPSIAIVGGIGYEDVEVSSRDALRDATGAPVIGSDGRLVTDKSAPRVLAFDVDGLLWDVGVMWRPSSRTSLSAHVGERYGSTTYYGNFSYAPSSRSALNISVYDGVTGFGGQLNNALAGLGTDFDVLRNPVTGDFGGLISGEDGAGVINSLGSVRSAAFRGRGVNANYQRRIGRMIAAIGAGYDRREFIGAEGTILESADGIVDENYYINGGLSRDIGRSANLSTSAYINWFQSSADNADATAFGASASYRQSLFGRLSARAAVAVDHLESDFSEDDLTTATALLGLRYDF